VRTRRLPLFATLAVALVAVGLVSSLNRPTNPSLLAGGLNVGSYTESTALFCTGLSGNVSAGASSLEGHVVFLNTTDVSRSLAVQVVNDLGQRTNATLRVGAHATTLVSPITLLKAHSYAVEAQVSGGGVVAQEVNKSGRAVVPCTSSGVTNWYGAGFDTVVGSSGVLSIYNPTATPAVFNVATYTSAGYAAPAPFQGLSVAAHSQLEVNLGTQVVNLTNVGVHVTVLRGSLAIVGVQQSGGVDSFITGATSPSKVAWFPLVTTVNGALAEIRVANPGATAADVTVHVRLAKYDIAPQSVTIPPYSSGDVVITPNSAIPASGYAAIKLTSNEPVVTSLASGTGAGVSLWTPQDPSANFLVSDFSGHGFNDATLTNTSTRSITVRLTTLGATSVSSSTTLAAGSTRSILSLFSGVRNLNHMTLLVKASAPHLLVTTSLPSSPVGVTVVSVLDGG
jgi:hypothetical protein